ncbi:C4-dicarboxylate ABC transporter, partial [Vibrio genomosp. F10 str. 9ZD137]
MTQTTTPSQDVQEMVAQADTGARNPKGIPGRILWFVPLCWSLFQLWYASPLPFIFNFAVLNDTQARAIHLTFAVFLAFTAYPASKNSSRDQIPIIDWLLALAGSFSAAYIYLFYTELAERSGAPTTFDIVAAVTGMILLRSEER